MILFFNTSLFGPDGFAGLLLEERGAGLVSGRNVFFEYISFRSGLVCWTSVEIE